MVREVDVLIVPIEDTTIAHYASYILHFSSKKDRLSAVFPYCNYIFSGAVQPISVMALCSTARVVSASFKRA